MAPGCTTVLFQDVKYTPADPVGMPWLNLMSHVCARSEHAIQNWKPHCRLEYSSCACGLRVG